MYLSDEIFLPFELNEKEHFIHLCDVDPELNYYNPINIHVTKCNYYLETLFNSEIKNETAVSTEFSMCHVNIRSAKKNIGSFENYLSLLDIEFTVIGVTETWFKEHDDSLYDLDGCHIGEIHRVNRLGGGVAKYIQTHLSFSVRPNIGWFDQDLETLFVEIEVKLPVKRM